MEKNPLSLKKFICIHGHFYQPPRENAWLEAIEVQDSAYPYHDWNERISAECYAPNAASRILNEYGAIQNIVNNYSRISFNFGPTLLSWMEQNDPETYHYILEADAEGKTNFRGHGPAIAQVYNHIILPLANSRDKETQIVWGIRDFVHRFNRQPEGMWLAETAVDLESLELLATHGIKYTILAPRQAKAVRKAAGEWQQVTTETVDTRRPYLCKLPSGKTIALFFYDGDIAQGVAFNGLLFDGKKFAHRMLDQFDAIPEEPLLVNVATDGETYGHHHKHGDMALGYALNYLAKMDDVYITNYGEFLALFPPTWEVELHENSSWSCVHGVERWRSNCGCNSGGLPPGWTQEWRGPLRAALDWVRDELVQVYLEQGKVIFKDPWKAREDYIRIILHRSDETIRKFLADHLLVRTDTNQVLRLLEMQRHTLLMYTSCGWFFDEVSGIETTQIMQYACRAIQLAAQIAGKDFEPGFIERLQAAPSNHPSLGNAGNIYTKYIIPAKTNLMRVGMHYAVASIFEEDPESANIFNYSTHNEVFTRMEAGEQKLVLGVTKIRSDVTRSEKRFSFGVLYLGQHNIIGQISLDMDRDTFASMQIRVTNSFEEGRLTDIITILQIYFGEEKFTIWQLFTDEKRKVFNLITEQSMRDLELSLRRIYNRDYPLVNALANNDTPIPKAYKTTFEYILNTDLVRTFESGKINLRKVEHIMNELARWNFNIEDSGKVERLAGDCIFKELKRIASEGGTHVRVERLNRLFPLLRKFNVTPSLHKSQNLYYDIFRGKVTGGSYSPEWIRQFIHLGDQLGVTVFDLQRDGD